MRVLFATIPQPKNRFVPDLQSGIGQFFSVVHDHEEFWSCDNSYDVVHIHEPEYLSYEIEACMYNTDPIPAELWARLISCLQHWRKNAIVIHTRHVQEPHVRVDDEFRKLYRTVFSYCHGVAHFAGYSVRQFKDFYPDLAHIHHAVIPHQNYSSLPDTTNREEARNKLYIPSTAKVMLVFGMIKEREKGLILDAFNAIPGDDKVVLAPGWKVPKPAIKWIRLREWLHKYQVRKAAKSKTMRTNLGFVEESDAQYYCHAADFLLIPRTNELNSGNITFGFTFGLVVVGKSDADIGEILLETGNPVFEVGNTHSLVDAVQRALVLAEDGHGQKNRDLALSEWGIDRIGRLYRDFYLTVASNSGQKAASKLPLTIRDTSD